MNSTLTKFVNVLCVLVALVLALLDISDLISYILDPAKYIFGTEVAGLRYTSAIHFLVSITATIVGAVVVCLIPLITTSALVVLLVRVSIVAVLIALTLITVFA
jgi:hypothetical protein